MIKFQLITLIKKFELFAFSLQNILELSELISQLINSLLILIPESLSFDLRIFSLSLWDIISFQSDFFQYILQDVLVFSFNFLMRLKDFRFRITLLRL